VYNTVLKAFENNADVSTFISVSRRFNSGGINHIDSKFLVSTRYKEITYKTSSIELLFVTNRQNGKDPSLL
jgi:hypothetical protein